MIFVHDKLMTVLCLKLMVLWWNTLSRNVSEDSWHALLHCMSQWLCWILTEWESKMCFNSYYSFAITPFRVLSWNVRLWHAAGGGYFVLVLAVFRCDKHGRYISIICECQVYTYFWCDHWELNLRDCDLLWANGEAISQKLVNCRILKIIQDIS